MKSRKRIVTTAIAAMLLVGVSIAATLAYLTANTGTVTNTFTVGNVSFDKDKNDGLDEVRVDDKGYLLDADGNQVKDLSGNPIMPKGVNDAGQLVDEKGNPLMTDGTTPLLAAEQARVAKNTYKLLPGKTYLKDPTLHIAEESEPAYVYVEVVNGLEGFEADVTIEDQMKAKWDKVEGNVWRYRTVVDALTAAKDLPVFTNFTIKTDADLASAPSVITVRGFAIQAEDITEDAADTAATKWFTDNSVTP